jgi:surface antigen
VKISARPLAAALFTVLALAACSAPQASGTGSAPASEVATPSATPTPSKSSGPFGGFSSAAEACSTISQQATGASLLPLSAAQGKTEELEQIKAELAETAEMAPDSLKADFEHLNEVAVAGLKDQTVFSSGKFNQAMTPVTAWLAANCK